MKLFDVIAMAIHNLWQRRMRTALNLIGVVIGCIVLLMTAAGASGVREAFRDLFDASEFARQIEIWGSYGSDEEPPEGAIIVEGDMSAERRERIRESMIQQWRSEQTDWTSNAITAEDLKEFGEIEHVQTVVPHTYFSSIVRLGDESDKLAPKTSVSSVGTALIGPNDDALKVVDRGLRVHVGPAGPPLDSMRRSIIAGNVLQDDDRFGAILHEYLAYQLGFRSDEDLQMLIGRKLIVEWEIAGKASSLFHLLSATRAGMTPEYRTRQLTFVAAFQQLIADLDLTSLSESQKQLLRKTIAAPVETRRDLDDVVVRRTFAVRGVYRPGASESFSKLFYQRLSGEHVAMQINRAVATELKLTDPEDQYFHGAVVVVDSSRDLRSVTDQIESSGLHVGSALQVLESIDRNIDQNTWIIYGVAAAILLTAAIGISNTLIISVMERTPEFGIMKSLGARDRDLVILMMLEGAALGLIGAATAILLSWSLSFVVQILLEMYIEGQMGGDIAGSLFHFSTLPALGMAAVATTVCVLASIAPAIRAARLDPVVAMRRTYELLLSEC